MAMQMIRQLLDVVDAVVVHPRAAATKHAYYVQELATLEEFAAIAELATLEDASANSDGCLPNTLGAT